MAASLLARGPVKLHRVPNISDVWTLTAILRSIGCKVDFDGLDTMLLDTSHLTTTTAPDHLVRKMNASFDIMGPLLAAYGEAQVSLPGGCNLGSRPVDLHLAGFRKLGAEVTSERGYVKAKAKRLTGGHIVFPKVSVGATKNCLMAATLAKGETLLENCAREPEIVDLTRFLTKMGAKIEGLGTPTLRIQGVDQLEPTEYTVVADRIEVGTYLLAAAITEGDLTIDQCVPRHVDALLDQLREAGQQVEVEGDQIRVVGRRPILPVSVTTQPYPGFPTDLHPQLVALRLGGDVRVTNRQVVVRGVSCLQGAPVDAPDIRAGGALVIAALAAQGESVITGVEFIDRGYQSIEKSLSSVGADIVRVDLEDSGKVA
jgi:UDP-N-acetylglucosamine 1-carboxyvinyltransferase